MPTPVRTTAMGLMSAAGRFGSIAAQISNGLLLVVNLWAPLVPGAGIMIIAAAGVLLLLPVETTGRPLEDGGADGVGGGGVEMGRRLRGGRGHGGEEEGVPLTAAGGGEEEEEGGGS